MSFKKRISFFLLMLIYGFLPNSKLKKKLLNKLNKIAPYRVHHREYGDVFLPLYNARAKISSREPDAYNADGNKMRSFFIRDRHFAHEPASRSNFFLWDRYNFGLKTHFYTHNSMLETMGEPTNRFGLLVESESIVPEDYKIFDRVKGLHEDFDLILTHSAGILEKIPNAIFYPGCAQVWIDKDDISENMHLGKSKNISMISSNKTSCDLHRVRLDLIRRLGRQNIIDAYGTFDGGKLVAPIDTLKEYRYSICLENYISPDFFTEKITNCFACCTVPIYLGCTAIGDIFNPDGIIQISLKDVNDIEKILRKCSEFDYEQRLPAILDNYQRVQPYFNIEDNFLFKAVQPRILS